MQRFAERIEQIVGDRDHGSRWLVREAIIVLREMASTPSIPSAELLKAGRRLALARPAMAALSGAVSRILDTKEDSALPSSAEIAQRASNLLAEYDTATEQIANAAQAALYGHVMTCSLSHTLVEVFTACRHRIERVYVLEGRPRYEGRTMAQALAQAGIAVTLLTDAQAAIFLPQCQCVAVGADSILEDGTVLNKAGTALLAWAAQGYSVPLYALAETLKISPRHWSNDQAHVAWLEEKEASEVWEQAPVGIQVRNFYFDATPAHLIRDWFTEKGALSQQDIARLACTVQAAMRHLSLDTEQ